MSNTDSFIEEVSEEVRKDQLYGYFKKYGWIAGLLIVAIVGGTAYSEWSKASKASNAEELGDRIAAALETDGNVQQADALAAILPDAGGAAALIEIQRAAVLADNDDKAGALDILDTLALDGAAPEIYRELAMLKSLMLRGSETEYGKRILALDVLAKPGAAFRAVALEQKALAMMDAGKTDDAIKQFQALLLEPQVSNAMSERARQSIIALGGTLPDIAEMLSNGVQAQ
ncbi:hypothetical protein GCM10008927_19590 [Amylibacter ulvae]|uniref:Tetratricopeptide repeat-like domain-containing protein n=1 Tax=Paramylibacter ulvae TaxID=1651968 RepID=A0ABQ3D5F7_9RHOB|nr:hypothetical protein [Amylibacter ulvae]GHA53783.1 hypothetical protein GCM10008927_19590 [Amylibacter ulvae]